MMNENNIYDLIILGGGAAGFAAAIKSNELGAKSLMVNAGLPIGGTCVNVGCVPSKKLLWAGEILHNLNNHRIPGIEAEIKDFDFSKIIQDEVNLVERMRDEKYQKVLLNLKWVKFEEGEAHFISEDEIDVGGKRYKGKKFIIATGSTTSIPPINGLKETGFITHIEALRMKELPKELLIIGAGPMGLEFGQMFARFGARVNILEILPTIFKPGEANLVKQLEAILNREGINIKTGVRVVGAYKEKGKKVLSYKVLEGKSEKEERIYGDEILLATGKTPNTDGLQLEKAKVNVDRRKAVIVNEFLQTSNEGIYAAGDVANLPLRLETTAGREGSIAVENALEGNRKRIDYNEVPYAIFTDPSLAGVGLTEEDMMNRYGVCSCRTLQFKDLPKAIIKNRTEGAVKLVIHPDTAQILGVHILAPDAGDLIAEGMLIIRNKMTIYDVIDTLPVFPTFSEAIKLCALSFIKNVSELSCCV